MTRKPPHSVRVLHKWISDHSDATGEPVVRAQRWVSFMVIATVLDRVRNERDEPLFLLKGGAAMELRLGLQARATKDFDVSFRERMDELLVHLDTALRQPYGDFTVTRSEVTPIGPTASQRLDVKLAYRGRSWQTVRLEIAPAEGAAGQDVEPVAGVPLDRFGLEALERVPCVSVRYQIAQKVHACTSIPGGRPNDRSRDLIDLLLLRDLIGAEDLGRVREACVETFELRDRHAWPPTVVVMEPWRLTYPLEATELDFDPLDVEVAAERVQRVIDEIDAAR